jgi:hypothetical protein
VLPTPGAMKPTSGFKERLLRARVTLRSGRASRPRRRIRPEPSAPARARVRPYRRANARGIRGGAGHSATRRPAPWRAPPCYTTMPPVVAVRLAARRIVRWVCRSIARMREDRRAGCSVMDGAVRQRRRRAVAARPLRKCPSAAWRLSLSHGGRRRFGVVWPGVDGAR